MAHNLLEPCTAPRKVRWKSRSDGRFFEAGIEPRLADMLRDPIVGLVMRRDKVSAKDVFSLFSHPDAQLS